MQQDALFVSRLSMELQPRELRRAQQQIAAQEEETAKREKKQRNEHFNAEKRRHKAEKVSAVELRSLDQALATSTAAVVGSATGADVLHLVPILRTGTWCSLCQRGAAPSLVSAIDMIKTTMPAQRCDP